MKMTYLGLVLLALAVLGKPSAGLAASDPSEAAYLRLRIGSPCKDALAQLAQSGFGDVDSRESGPGEKIFTTYADRSNQDWSAVEFGCGEAKVKWTSRRTPQSAAPLKLHSGRASIVGAEDERERTQTKKQPARSAPRFPSRSSFKKGWEGQLDRAKAMVQVTKTYQDLVKPVRAWATEGQMSFEEAQRDMYYNNGLMSYQLFQVMEDPENELVGFSFPIRRPPYPGAGPDSIISAQDYMLSPDWFIVDVRLDKVLYGRKGIVSSWKEIP